MKANKKQVRLVQRLKKRSSFLHVRQEGQYWRAPAFILQACKNKNEGLRVGLTVTKKVSTSSVVRNRIRRRLNALACDVLPVHAQSQRDYVLIGRIGCQDRSYALLEKDLIGCLEKLNCKKP